MDTVLWDKIRLRRWTEFVEPVNLALRAAGRSDDAGESNERSKSEANVPPVNAVPHQSNAP
jgi:hypothetical protein